MRNSPSMSRQVSPFLELREGTEHFFCRPRLFEPRGECPDELWQGIWKYIPRLARQLDPHLVYSTSLHGKRLKTLLRHCEEYVSKQMVFFANTMLGDIVGGYSPIMFIPTHNRYVDCFSTGNTAAEA